ncbi:MAG: nickel pincer cofactor biosynthesis protein LarC [Actinobacteria bacterium]|nr:nickel pincer cofactor biosynthesis protein LarC [Actinomycetota bacterium]
MSKIIYIDCFSGISGDMMAGALLDLDMPGIDLEFLKNEVKKLDIKDYGIESEKQQAGALYATGFGVYHEGRQPSRNFMDIKKLIDRSSLGDSVKKLSIEIFSEIADAEGKVHKKPADEVHFHEVGAIDSIIDIVCVSAAITKIGAGLIYSRQVPLGKGFADTMHGKIPVPAPATVELLKGFPVYGGGFDFEVTTPTGAAMLKVLCDGFCDMPAMQVERSGNGAGSRFKNNPGEIPDMLRLFFGTQPEYLKGETLEEELERSSTQYGNMEKLLVISANLDNFSPEIAGYALEKFLSLGARDAWIEPVYMKKNRPAFKICVLAGYKDLDKFIKTAFVETPTLGIKIEEVYRISLNRETKKVKLPYGEAEVKIGFLMGGEVTVSPEYESCASLAKKTGKPLREIYRDLMFLFSSR